jgi:hypothetical protein
MLSTVLSRLASSGFWRASSFSDLPEPYPDAPATTRQMLLLAGGLALLLSRCLPEQIDRDFPHARDLYAQLRRDLKRYGRTSASVELFLETFHEVSDKLDQLSRQALKDCLAARQRWNQARSRRSSSLPQDERTDAFTSRVPLTEAEAVSSGASSQQRRVA